MRGHLVEVEHGLAAHLEAGESALPLRPRLRPEYLLHVGVGASPVVADCELHLDEVGPADRVAKRRPELRLQRADAVEAALFALVDAVARVTTAQTMVTPPDRLSRGALREGQCQPAHGSV